MEAKKPATNSAGYVRFIAERDQALEKLYVRTVEEINDLMRKLLTRTMEIVGFRYATIPNDALITMAGRRVLQSIDDQLHNDYLVIGKHMGLLIEELNAAAYTLALVGESEAIGRALKIPAKYSVPRGTPQILGMEDAQGESVEGRVQLALSKIRREVMNALELARVKEESIEDALLRVRKALPKARRVKRPKRTLSKVKEAKPGEWSDKQDFSVGFVTDEDWRKIVTKYVSEYVPKYRGPETVFDVEVDGLLEEWFGWEIESYMAHEFVAKVRAGQNEAAKQNGIVDLQWVAIVDDKTDHCCSVRDGLTSSEIKELMDLGEIDKEECDAIIPPAHFNCRCTMSPILEEQMAGGDFEAPASNAKEFEEWLNS